MLLTHWLESWRATILLRSSQRRAQRRSRRRMMRTRANRAVAEIQALEDRILLTVQTFAITGGSSVMEVPRNNANQVSYTIGFNGSLTAGETASVKVNQALGSISTSHFTTTPIAALTTAAANVPGLAFNTSTNTLTLTATGATSTVSNFAGTAADVANSGDMAWQNPSHAVGNTPTTFTQANADKSDEPHELVLTNFGFNIPTGATINGITATLVTTGSNDPSSGIGIQLTKNGTAAVGTTPTATSGWSSGTVAIGSSTNLWGTTWAPSDLNSSNFGLLIQPQANSDGQVFKVYTAKISVAYTITTQPPSSLTFTAIVGDDQIVEGNQSYAVNLSSPTTTDPGGAALGTSSVTTTVIDNDIAFSLTGGTSVSEDPTNNGNRVSYTISYADTLGPGQTASVDVAEALGSIPAAQFTTDPIAAISAAVASAQGVSFVNNQTLTFANGTGNATSLTFTVVVADDHVSEGNQTYSINLSNPQTTSPSAAFITSGASSVQTTVIDNDIAFSIAGTPAVTEYNQNGSNQANYTISYSGSLLNGHTASVNVGEALGNANPAHFPVDPLAALASAAAASPGVSFNNSTDTLTFGPGTQTGSPSGFAGTATIGATANSRWTNPSNAVGNTPSDFAETDVDKNDSSDQLKLTNFGFNIPAGATINGVTVTLVTTGSSNPVNGSAIQITKDGSNAIGTTPSTSSTWSSGSVVVGSNTSLWGTTWTAAAINSSNFGILIQPQSTTDGQVFRIYTAMIAVSYSVPVLPTSLGFAVNIADDHLVEPDQTYSLSLSSAQTTGSNYAYVATASAATTILTDDVVFSITGGTSVGEDPANGDNQVSYTIGYTGHVASGQTASVDVQTLLNNTFPGRFSTGVVAAINAATPDATGVSFDGTTLTFSGGTGNSPSLTFTVAIASDSFPEPNETYSILLSNPQTTVPNEPSLQPAQNEVTTTIYDSQLAFTIIGGSVVTQNPTNGGNLVSYTIDYSGLIPAGQSASIDVTHVLGQTNSSDYTTDPIAAIEAAVGSATGVTFNGTTLTFDGGAGEANSLTFTVAISTTANIPVAETYSIDLTDPTTTAPTTASIGVGTVSTTILSSVVSGTPQISVDNPASLEGGPATGTLFGAPAALYMVGGHPLVVTTADLNRDGLQDIITTNNRGGVLVSLNNGAGGFSSTQYVVGGGGFTTSVVVADLNGDGLPDIAATWVQSDVGAQTGNGGVGILRNNGNGTFTLMGDYGVGSEPAAIVAGDFNGDGKTDLAVANSNSNSVSLLSGNGDFTFHAAVNITVGPGPTDIKTVDLNGDGKPDLVVANSGIGGTGTNTVSLLLNAGNGTFTRRDISAGVEPRSIAIADFNGDGHLDIAVANSGIATDISGTFNAISILFGDGTGNFTPVAQPIGGQPLPANTYLVAFPNPNAQGTVNTVTAGDLDGDGVPDLVVTDAQIATDDPIAIMLNDGHGAFNSTLLRYLPQVHGTQVAQHQINSAVIADIANDGEPDIVTSNTWGTGGVDGLAIFDDNLNRHTLTFTVTLSNPSNSPVWVNYATADGTANANVDYIPESGLLFFAPGRSVQTVKVPIIGDTVAENDETVILNLSNPVNATIADGTGTGTILDDDPIDVTISGGATVNEDPTNGGNQVSYTISYTNTLAPGATASVKITHNLNTTTSADYTTDPIAAIEAAVSGAQGVSFNPATRILTFTGGAGNATSLTFMVVVADRHIVGGTKSYSIDLSNPVITGGGTEIVVGGDATTTINENDADRPPIFNPASYQFTLGGSIAAGGQIGTISATDPDLGDTVTYSGPISSSAPFAVDPNTGAVTWTGGAIAQGTYNLVFDATDNHGDSTSANVAITVGAGIATSLKFLQVPSTGIAGQALTPAITVAVDDQFGNLVSSDTSTITLSVASGPGGFTSGSTVVLAASGGVATFDNVALDTAGTYVIHAADSTLNGATSGSIVISAPAAARLVFQTVPGNGVAGAALSPAVVVDVEDQFGNLVTSDTSQVSLTVATGPGVLTGTTTVKASGGVATFNNLLLDTAGTYTLSASDGTLTGATSSNIVISPAAANHVAFQMVPGTGTAGAALNSVTVAVEDQFGNVNTSDSSSTVTLTVVSGPGTFVGITPPLTAPVQSGIATFDGILFDVAGTYKLGASDGTLAPDTSGNIVINPALASHLAFLSPFPTSGTAGVALSPAVKVAIEDQFDNIETADSISTVLLVVSSGPVAGFDSSSNPSAIVSSGIATFNNVALDKVGSYMLSAQDGSITSSPSTSILISPAAASQLVFQSVPTSAIAGEALSPAFQVLVEDPFNNLVTTQDGTTVTLTANGPGGIFGTPTATVTNGIAPFDSVVLHTAGTYTLSAQDGSLTSLQPSNTISVSPAEASKLVFTQQPADGAFTTLSPQPQVTVEDVFSNVVTTDHSSITLEAVGPGHLNGTTTQPAQNGVATFPGLTLSAAGHYQLKATDDSLTFALTNSFLVDDPPAFNSSSYSFNLADNATAGAAVGTVSATDPDGGTVLQFSGPTPVTAPFEIDQSTGQITYTGSTPPQFHSVFNLVFTVTDAFGATGTTSVTVNVVAATNGPPTLALFDVTSGTEQAEPSGGTDPFGSELINSPPISRSFTIYNSGGGTLNVSQLTITNTDGLAIAPFSSDLSVPVMIPSGNSISFSVTLHDATAGTFTETMSIPSNDPSSPFTLTLTGTVLAQAPKMVVGFDPGTSAFQDDGILDFGLSHQGGTVSKELFISNAGDAVLHLAAIAVSPNAGFILHGPLTQGTVDVEPGEFTTLTITVDTTTAATDSSILTITNVDSTNFPPFNLHLAADVAPASSVLTLDDNAITHPSGWVPLESNEFQPSGYLGVNNEAVQWVQPNNLTGAASPFVWNFTGLQPGTYRVLTTWPTPDRTENISFQAPFSIYNGSISGTPLLTQIVDQRMRPMDVEEDGTAWASLGTVTITSAGQLTVALNPPSGDLIDPNRPDRTTAIADAVRIERVDDPTPHDDVFELAAGHTSYTLDVLANDPQASGTVQIAQGPSASAGTVTVVNNQIVFTVAPGKIGKDLDANFTYTLTNGGTTSAPANVTLHLSAIAPIVHDNTFTTSQIHSLTIDPRVNAIDPQGSPLTISLDGLDDGQNLVPDGAGGFLIPTAQTDGYLFVLHASSISDTWSLQMQVNGTNVPVGTTPYNAENGGNFGADVQAALRSNLGVSAITVTQLRPRIDIDSFGVSAQQLLISGLPDGTNIVFNASGSSPAISATVVTDRGHLTPNADGTWHFTPNDDYYSIWGNYSVGIVYTASDSANNVSHEPAIMTLRVQDSAPRLDAPREIILAHDSGDGEQDVPFPLATSDTDGEPLYAITQLNPANQSTSITFGQGLIQNGSVTLTLVVGDDGAAQKYFFVSDGFERSNVATTTFQVMPVTDILGTETIDSRFVGDPVLITHSATASTGWSLQAEAVNDGLNQATSQTFGSVDADLSRGTVSVSEGLDANAQASGTAPFALTYDSSLAQPVPVLRGTLLRTDTDADVSSIDVTANWFSYVTSTDGSGTQVSLSAVPNESRSFTLDLSNVDITGQNTFTIDAAFPNWTQPTGLYRWTMAATIALSDGTERFVSLAGDAFIRRQDSTTDGPFGGLGAGWEISGIPYLNIFNLSTDPVPDVRIDDVAVLSVAGGGSRFFQGIRQDTPILSDGQHTVRTFEAADPATRVQDPQEFGTLVEDFTTNTWSYTLPDGTIWLFDRLSGLAQSVTTPDGLKTSFTYDGDGHIATITATDSSLTTFDYSGDNTVSITLPENRTITLTVTSDQLTGLTISGTSGVVYSRAFQYKDGTNLLTQDTIGANPDGTPIANGSTVTSMTYDNQGFLASITVGNAKYQVLPATALTPGATEDSTDVPADDVDALLVGTPFAEVRELFAPGDTLGSDLMVSAGTLWNGTITSDYQFDHRGELLQQDVIVQQAGGTETTRTTFERDFAGQVSRMVEGQVIDTILGTPVTKDPGRETINHYDYEDQSKLFGAIDSVVENGSKDDGDELFPTVPNILQDSAPRPVVEGNLTSIFSAFTTETDLYDAFGYLISQTDALGNVTTFDRDNQHRVIEEDGPLNSVEKWFYGTFTSGSFSDAAILLAFIDARGLITTYQYDSKRRVTKTTSGAGTLDTQDNATFSTTPNLLEVTTYDYDGGFGNPTTILTEDGTGHVYVTTSDTYDATGNLLRDTVDDTQYTNDHLSQTAFIYYLSGLLEGQSAGIQDSSGNLIYTQYKYDSQGNQTESIDGTTASQNGSSVMFSTTSLSVDSKSTYYKGGELETSFGRNLQVVSDFYNPLDRTTSVVTSGVAVNGSLSTHTVTSTSDQFGNVVTTEDNLTGLVTNFTYDRRDNLLSKVELAVASTMPTAGSAPAFNVLTTYSYDALGQLLQEQDNIAQTFVTDGQGQQQAVVTPTVAAQHFEYDANGNVTLSNVVAPGGMVMEYTYNASGDVLTSTEQRRTPIIASPGQFATTLYTTTNKYDVFGRVLTSQKPIDPDGTNNQQFVDASTDYDQIGRIATTTSTDDLTNPTVTYAKTETLSDGLGQTREQDNLLDGSRQTSTYNAAGELVDTMLAFSANPTTVAANFRRTYYQYDVLGRQTLIGQAVNPIGTDDSDLVVKTSYEDNGELGIADAVSSVSTTVAADAFDAANFSVPETTVYSDAEGRTVQVDQPDPGAHAGSNPDHAPQVTHYNYAYSQPSGGLITVTTTDLTTTDPTTGQPVNRTNRVITNNLGWTLEKDQPAAGATVGQPTTDFTYDAAGRVVDELDLTYDGQQVPGQKILNSVTISAYDFATGLLAFQRDAQAVSQVNLNAFTSLIYDSAGNLVQRTDPDHNVTFDTFDGLNRITSETVTPEPTGMTSNVRSWSYNGLTTVYTDRDGRITQTITNPVTDAVTEKWFSPGSILQTATPIQTYITTSNPAGQTLDTSGSSGATVSDVTNTYDALGRLANTLQTGSAFGTTTPSAQFDYAYSPTIFDVNSQNESNIAGSEENVTLSLNQTPGPVAGNNVEFSVTTYDFDNLGRDWGVKQDLISAGAILWMNQSVGRDKNIRVVYNADNTPSQLVRQEGLNYSEGTGDNLRGITTYDYGPTGNLTAINNQINRGHASGNTLSNYAYTYDSSTNTPSSYTSNFYDVGTVAPIATESRVVHADTMGRLNVVNLSFGATSTSWNYTYDAAGNRVTAQPADTASTVNAQNQLVSGPVYSYQYDNEGHVIQRTANANTNTGSVVREVYTWDNRGRLTEVDQFDSSNTLLNTIQYVYDALDRRIGEKITPASGAAQVLGFVYSGSQQLLTIDVTSGVQTAGVIQSNFYGPLGDLNAIDVAPGTASAGTTQTVWAFADPAGAIRTVARFDENTSSWIVLHRQTDEFGNLYDTQGTAAARSDIYLTAVPLYLGSFQLDPQTGLYLAGSRWYDPTDGRFLAPSGPGAGDYGFNPPNPMNLATGYVSGGQIGDSYIPGDDTAFFNGFFGAAQRDATAIGSSIVQAGLMLADIGGVGVDWVSTVAGHPINYQVRSGAAQALESGQLSFGQYAGSVAYGALNTVTGGLLDEGYATVQYLAGSISVNDYSERLALGAFNNVVTASAFQSTILGKVPLAKLPASLAADALQTASDIAQVARSAAAVGRNAVLAAELARFSLFDYRLYTPRPSPVAAAVESQSPGFVSLEELELSARRRTIVTSGVEEQLDVLANEIPGLVRPQAKVLLEGAFDRKSSVVFGGSRVRGNYRPDSDLDVGFGSLTTGQARRLLNKAQAAGGLNLEETLIVPGNETAAIPRISSPEEFFQRSGVRVAPDKRAGERFGPSGSITANLNGTITVIRPGI
jgi:YD repeat-containing protein